MGNAQANVANKTTKRICVLTFNNADLLYKTYNTMYIIEPGETKLVEASSDPIGLKIGIVYDASPEGQGLFYQRWQLKNNSVITVTYMNGADISTFGEDTIASGKGSLSEKSEVSFSKVVEALTYQAPITRAARR